MSAFAPITLPFAPRIEVGWPRHAHRPPDEDDEEEIPIGDPEPDDFDGDDWDEDDDEPIHASPRPPKGPGDADDDELPVGDPPDDDPTDDPDDEDEGEEDDEPLHGLGGVGSARCVRRCLRHVSCSRAADTPGAGSGSGCRSARPARSPSGRTAGR